ncbi:hypothetical protein BON22_0829 [Cyberlindnera fabianii]|uniref:Uncharacterized protein n=1 Tax=Cyberlindnera fabianii TaxID=36022 RepID=A0A1V2LDK7_CYBFA|nr:hypothetical protein BON22_0829 [Cyberlindnera fabianii]
MPSVHETFVFSLDGLKPHTASTVEEDLMLETRIRTNTIAAIDGLITLRHSPPPSPPTILHLNRCLLPNQRVKFISAAINGFIIANGPQLTHSLLTTSSTFTPMIYKNDLLISIAEACGASYLSWSNRDLCTFSSKKYSQAMIKLQDYVNKNGYREEDETWMAAAFQLMCLGSKATWGCDRSVCATNLRMCYNIIKNKMSRWQKVQRRTPSVVEVSASLDEFAGSSLAVNDSLDMEIQNALIGYSPSDTDEQISHFDRMFVESFIYNYSIIILVTPDSEGLPNPFEVFRNTRRFLKTPLFNCEVAWMNNPVVGASFDSFEMAAKSSYLIRHLGEDWVHGCALKLLEMTNYYPPPVLPQQVRLQQKKYQTLKDSVLVSEIVMKSSKIILHKVINRFLHESDDEIQIEVSCAIDKIKQISPTAMVRIIAPWAFFVIGLACINFEHRKVIMESCIMCAEIIHGHYISTITNALQKAWGMGTNNGDYTLLEARGLDVLLDGDMLSKVFL